MKNFAKIFMCLMPVLVACDMLGEGPEGKKGELRVAFGDLPPEETRAAMEMPDTNDFLLNVTDSEGEVIYDGLYKDAPESVIVKEGSYTVKVLSREFSKPQFSAPQYGDEQCVVVKADEVVSVKLICSQVNSGVRLKTSPDFLTAYPDASLVLKSDEGSLSYSYSETRIAYFLSGNISLVLSQGGTDDVLLKRWLGPGEILSLGVGVSQKQDPATGLKRDDISISIDTSRVWIEEHYIIGEEDQKGKTAETALSLSQAKVAVGSRDVWVRGYVVGGDLTTGGASFEPPFTVRTCVLLGPKVSTTNRESCVAVQLSSGSVRDSLNLVDNPELLGKVLAVKGDIVDAYYGLVGVKNISDFVF